METVMVEGFFKALENSLAVLSVLSRNIVESVDLFCAAADD
jgi:hypothetical protein